MRIEIKDIGQIERACIDLEGITVIAGENNTGKSTIGKTVFALLQGMYNWNDIYISLCQINLKKVLENKSILLEEFCLSHTSALRRRTNKVIDLLDKLCQDREFLTFVEDYQVIGDKKIYTRLKKYCKDYISLYEKERQQELIDRYNDYINEWIEGVLAELVKVELDETVLQANYIKDSFSTSFKSQYITEGKDECAVIFEKERTSSLTLTLSASDISAPIRFGERVYFVESPKIFDEIGRMGNDVESFRQLMIPNTLTKLPAKKEKNNLVAVHETKDHEGVPKEAEKILTMLRQEMNGQAEYYAKEGIKFKERGIKGSIYPENVSTGVKALAFLEYAVRLGAIQKNDILILDEPEINLHPQWQVVYARTLICLQKIYNLTLIITTHRPYFLRALECFSDRYDTMETLNVYYVSKDFENKHTIKNVMNSEFGMTELYEKLSAVFDALQEEIDSLYADEKE